ncbi:alkaline shock protein [Anopheles sinensis]|uniref:Alkaline shock protein n=1 Tax=Anopheles sinensis TaxID=74873 RepID=A0A084VF15_ANOSI|nr:alkaline shock protein [Anopheles sinensis]
MLPITSLLRSILNSSISTYVLLTVSQQPYGFMAWVLLEHRVFADLAENAQSYGSRRAKAPSMVAVVKRRTSTQEISTAASKSDQCSPYRRTRNTFAKRLEEVLPVKTQQKCSLKRNEQEEALLLRVYGLVDLPWGLEVSLGLSSARQQIVLVPSIGLCRLV